MKHTAQNIRIRRGAAGPLQRVHLKVALDDVGIERRELVRAQVEVDADVAQVLLNDGRLQAVELDVRHLERQREPRAGSVTVGIADSRPRRGGAWPAPGRT